MSHANRRPSIVAGSQLLRAAKNLSLALAIFATACGDSDDNDSGPADTGTGTGSSTLSGSDSSTGSTSMDSSTDSTHGDKESDIMDPAPELNEPGKYTSDGCPQNDAMNFNVEESGVSKYPIVGYTRNADGPGEFYVRGVNGQAIGGPLPFSAEGSEYYSIEIPIFCGEQLVKLVWRNASGSLVLVYRLLARDCVEPNLRATLTWDEAGIDWDLHLIRGEAKLYDPVNDCSSSNCVDSSPDWGVIGNVDDNPRKDVDNSGASGLESISLRQPEEGMYTVVVEHWGNGDPTASGQVIFNIDGAVQTTRIEALPAHHVWVAGTISWPSKLVIPKSQTYDCSGEWADGCRADIP